jgi:hypothetical protein
MQDQTRDTHIISLQPYLLSYRASRQNKLTYTAHIPKQKL